MFNSRPLIVKTCTPGFNFNEEVLRVIPLGVKLPNLPLNCWTADSLSRIVNILVAPRFADEATMKQKKIPYARLSVEIDATLFFLS